MLLCRREHYCDALDSLITSIKERFDKSDFKLHSHWQNLLSEPRNGLLYKEKYNIVGEVCIDQFNAFNAEYQVRFLLRFIKASNLLSQSDLINAFKVFPGSSHAILAGFRTC